MPLKEEMVRNWSFKTQTQKTNKKQVIFYFWGEWPSGLNCFRQVTEVGLGRVRSNSG